MTNATETSTQLPTTPLPADRARDGGGSVAFKPSCQALEAEADGVSLVGQPLAWLDRLLPPQPRAFLITVAMLSGGVWLLGLALAEDRLVYLQSHEWQIQPLFLAGHIIALRLFVTSYAVNYLRGARHLDVMPTHAQAWVRNTLRPAGGVAALLLAAPFIALDLFEWHKYVLRPDVGTGAADILMALIWSIEWIVNAYIWILLVAFAVLTAWTVRTYPFRDSTEVLLQERHYRPFLVMGVQGSTILLFFGILYAAYVWYADGELSDFIGLGITIALLLGCFVPPWLLLKSRLEGQVRRENAVLAKRLMALRSAATNESRPSETTAIHQSDEIVTMLRMAYLDRLQQELGRSEGRAVIMRLLVPVSTIGWKFIRPLLFGL